MKILVLINYAKFFLLFCQKCREIIIFIKIEKQAYYNPIVGLQNKLKLQKKVLKYWKKWDVIMLRVIILIYFVLI